MSSQRYDHIVFEFLDKRHGELLLFSEDQVFVKVLRQTLVKTLGIRHDCLTVTDNMNTIIKAVGSLNKRGSQGVIFMEQTMDGKPMTDFLHTLRQTYPDLKIIALVGETQRAAIAYLYEMGVHNVISKPASANNIIEKLAFTIQPQGKLSKYMHEGKKMVAAGKIKEALALSNKILQIKPNSPAALMLRGDAYLAKENREQAIESYLEAHKSSKLYLEPLKKLADAFKGVDEDSYLKYLKKLDKLSPLNIDRKYDIGQVYIERKETTIAEKFFDEALETATQQALTMVSELAERIAAIAAEHSPALNEKYLTIFIETRGNTLTKDDIGVFNRLGIALRTQGKWKEAIENYKRALEISPKDEGLYYNMGMAWRDGRNRGNALDCFQRALEMNPGFFKGNIGVSLNLGTIYSEMRRYDDALKFFEEACRIKPDHKGARQALAAIKRALKD